VNVRIGGNPALRGEVRVPGDKSIAHRALMFGAIAHGWTRVAGLSRGEDVASTIRVLGDLGVAISRNDEGAVVQGRGPAALDARGATLDCGNSGTTIRLLTGLLAGGAGSFVLTGDASLQKRPMRRIAEPLALLGARVALAEGGRAPIAVTGSALRGATVDVAVASAQVKTALIFAALHASGPTRLRGALASRDHTERMLPLFGGRIDWDGDDIVVPGEQRLRGAFVRVPGDPSSAAFWLAGAAIAPGSDVAVRDVSINPTRLGFVRALQRMGANVAIEGSDGGGEPVGTLRASGGPLRAIAIGADDVPDLLDELPLLAVLATQAAGRTVVRGAAELRVKESDRIATVAEMVRALGGSIEEFEDGFAIEGGQALRGGAVRTHGDHRIAMAAAIAALAASGETTIEDADCASVSYPEFFATFAKLEAA